MLQTFKSPDAGSEAAGRLKAVRQSLEKAGLDGYLIPRADEHQGEYVPPSAERLKWLTGFSGSAGVAAITKKRAAVFVDGRYTVQVAQECDRAHFEFPGLARTKLVDWLIDAVPKGGTIGFDPWLHTAGEIARVTASLSEKGLLLKPVPANLVDRAWGKGRPRPPEAPVVIQPLEFAGQAADEKIAAIQKKLAAERQFAAVLTLPDSIAWLLNIRGSDVPHNPVALAFAIVPATGKVELFIRPAKVSKDVRRSLEKQVRFFEPDAFSDRLTALKKAKRRVHVDRETAAFGITRRLGDKSVSAAADPCLALKAIKNAAEIAGAKAAHLRDGAAVSEFLCWLDGAVAGGSLDEIGAVQKLEEFRRDTGKLKDISFDTISGSGPNGAIVHYRVSEKTNRKLAHGELFLLDSGAQYADGTTDITRTVAIGKPAAEMRQRFTLVLKGHIAVATACFPKGTRGIDIDPFARRALWAAGLDYDHGTGHGIGSYLSVHEGPQSISRAGMFPLEPGMICSNEPGYYKPGEYGIRIENVVLVTAAETPSGGERAMMGFETLTLAPIDRRLIEKSLLTAEDVTWLDGYHARVFRMLADIVAPATRAWLKAATATL